MYPPVPLCPSLPCVCPCTPVSLCALQGAGKGKALEFILKELKEVGAYPEAGVQVWLLGGGWQGGGHEGSALRKAAGGMPAPVSVELDNNTLLASDLQTSVARCCKNVGLGLRMFELCLTPSQGYSCRCVVSFDCVFDCVLLVRGGCR